MKKVFTAIFAICIFSFIQAQEQQLVFLGFYKVNPGMEDDYETAMIEYQGEIMKERVKNGCMRNWIFREVLPNSQARNYFTHMTVDVLNVGADNYNCPSVSSESVFPQMSDKMRSLINKIKNSSRTVVYRTVVKQVAGFNRDDKLSKIGAWNFITTKPGKKQAYIDRNKEFSLNQYMNFSNQQSWWAWERYDARVGGSLNWDYLSFDGYNNLSDKLNRKVNTPPSIKNKEEKKYGPLIEMRDLNQQVVTRLLMEAK